MKPSRKSVYMFFVSVLICVAYFLFFGPRTSRVVNLVFSDTQMTAKGPNGYLWECELAHISGLDLVVSMDLGTCQTGDETQDYCAGTWQNSAYGEYQVCASKHIGKYIVLTTEDKGVFVFNYETANNTEILYNSLIKTLEERE